MFYHQKLTCQTTNLPIVYLSSILGSLCKELVVSLVSSRTCHEYLSFAVVEVVITFETTKYLTTTITRYQLTAFLSCNGNETTFK